jgi:endonuclease/exonuclease/phosphatase family metal-dependent hydrolase
MVKKQILVLMIFLCANCKLFQETNARENPETLTIGTWNIQALFDGEESGTEYSDYTESGGWNSAKYQARLLSISKGIETLGNNGPDVMALIEVENAGVLDELLKEYLPKHGYGYSYFTSNRGGALGIGIISRLPLIETKSHSISSGGQIIPRPLMEVRADLGNGEYAVIFACHWKSKLGGEEKTEELRRAAARLIVRRMAELQAEDPGTPVIVLGDLNENYDEFYRIEGSYISALLPDDPAAAAAATAATAATAAEGSPGQLDYLILSAAKPPKAEHFPERLDLPGAENAEPVVFFSPWYEGLDEGSYYYKSAWETIDHVLLNAPWFDGEGWDYAACRVNAGPPFATSSGRPATYQAYSGNGTSDHLPLVLTITRQ